MASFWFISTSRLLYCCSFGKFTTIKNCYVHPEAEKCSEGKINGNFGARRRKIKIKKKKGEVWNSKEISIRDRKKKKKKLVRSSVSDDDHYDDDGNDFGTQVELFRKSVTTSNVIFLKNNWGKKKGTSGKKGEKKLVKIMQNGSAKHWNFVTSIWFIDWLMNWLIIAA